MCIRDSLYITTLRILAKERSGLIMDIATALKDVYKRQGVRRAGALSLMEKVRKDALEANFLEVYDKFKLDRKSVV